MTSQQTCSVDSCDKPVRCKGMCDTHYRESLPVRWCSADGCTSKVRARGLCRTHDKGPQSSRAKRTGPCTVDGCDKPVRCKGMCVTHYYRSKDGRPLDGTQSRRDRVIEDAEWIAGTDHPDSIAVRCGFANADTLHDALRRWGRQDLVDKCLRWWLTHGDQRAAA